MNLLEGLTPETLAARGFAWEHVLHWEPLQGGGIRVAVPPVTDYFRDPAGEKITDNGPYLWREVTGDFVARAHVRPTFAGRYDAGGILVRQDAERWAKLCYESTNFGTTAAISVVTRGLSDDANGVDLAVAALWLQVCRVGDAFGMQYALDGKTWRKVRRFHLPFPRTLRVGLLAQSPGAAGTAVDFLWFSVESRTVADTRTGVWHDPASPVPWVPSSHEPCAAIHSAWRVVPTPRRLRPYGWPRGMGPLPEQRE